MQQTIRICWDLLIFVTFFTPVYFDERVCIYVGVWMTVKSKKLLLVQYFSNMVKLISPKKCILVAVRWMVFAIKMSTLATSVHSIYSCFSFSSGSHSWVARVGKWRMKEFFSPLIDCTTFDKWPLKDTNIYIRFSDGVCTYTSVAGIISLICHLTICPIGLALVKFVRRTCYGCNGFHIIASRFNTWRKVKYRSFYWDTVAKLMIQTSNNPDKKITACTLHYGLSNGN